MDAAVQETLGAVLRDHRSQLPRDLWRAACMKCMLVAAASVDRMQRAMHAAAQKAADKSTTDAASSTPTGTAAAAAAVPAPAEGKAVVAQGLEWGKLDQAMLAMIQLRLRTYHQVLHESAPQVWEPIYSSWTIYHLSIVHDVCHVGAVVPFESLWSLHCFLVHWLLPCFELSDFHRNAIYLHIFWYHTWVFFSYQAQYRTSKSLGACTNAYISGWLWL